MTVRTTYLNHLEALTFAGGDRREVNRLLRDKGINPYRICGYTVLADGRMVIEETTTGPTTISRPGISTNPIRRLS